LNLCKTENPLTTFLRRIWYESFLYSHIAWIWRAFLYLLLSNKHCYQSYQQTRRDNLLPKKLHYKELSRWVPISLILEASYINPYTIVVRIENDRLGFYFILFYFSFIFSYLVENKTKKTKCDIVTGHMNMVTEVTWSRDIEKGIEGSGIR